MKAIKILALLAFVSSAQAEVLITKSGSSVVTQSGSTTYVTGANPRGVAVPVTVNPVTGIGQVHTPQGSYLVQRSSSGTTTVIQTSKSR